jgi:hypothetical protein
MQLAFPNVQCSLRSHMFQCVSKPCMRLSRARGIVKSTKLARDSHRLALPQFSDLYLHSTT